MSLQAPLLYVHKPQRRPLLPGDRGDDDAFLTLLKQRERHIYAKGAHLSPSLKVAMYTSQPSAKKQQQQRYSCKSSTFNSKRFTIQAQRFTPFPHSFLLLRNRKKPLRQIFYKTLHRAQEGRAARAGRWQVRD